MHWWSSKNTHCSENMCEHLHFIWKQRKQLPESCPVYVDVPNTMSAGPHPSAHVAKHQAQKPSNNACDHCTHNVDQCFCVYSASNDGVKMYFLAQWQCVCVCVCVCVIAVYSLMIHDCFVQTDSVLLLFFWRTVLATIMEICIFLHSDCVHACVCVYIYMCVHASWSKLCGL